MTRPIVALFIAVGTALIAGCATPPPATKDYPGTPATSSATAAPATTAAPGASPVGAPTSAPPTVVVDSSVAERALASAISAYERGEFASAIRQLNPLTTDGSLDSAQQQRALKILAFSQCSSNARTACRQSFERALRTDPTFELAAAERGHPLWQPEFDRAKKAVLGR